MSRSLILHAMCFILISMSSSVIAQDLLVRYTFDEPSGAALDTGVGAASDGTLGPVATRTDNTPGMVSPFALDLRAEGADSFVNAGDSMEVDTLESFTLTTWLLLEGLNSEQGGSGNVRLVAKQGPSSAFNGFSWNLNGPNIGGRGTDSFRTGLFIGGEQGFGFTFASEDSFADEWAFLAVTYDGSIAVENTAFYMGDTESEVFLLGDLIDSIGVGPVASSAGEADFGIGFTDAAPGLDFAAVGFQDDVRVYSGALTLEQLEAVRLENLTPVVATCDPNTGGDIDGDGEVAFADFLILSANFGTVTDTHATGDIDCNGEVAFADFLILSANFGTVSGNLAAVPEPSAYVLLISALLFVRSFRFSERSR